MTMSALQQMKTKAGAFSKLLADVEKIKTPELGVKNYNDDRIYKLTIDKAGNGASVIRFLDAPKGEDAYWATIFKHGFAYVNGVIQPQNAKVAGMKWYLENSLSSLGEVDYVAEQNKIAWANGNQDLARARKRTLNYYSNILIVNDPEKPELNGKVMLFKYGKAVMEIIMNRTKDSEKDPLDDDSEVIEGINPFCFWTGADFALKIKRKDGWPTYIDSAFRKPKALFGGDDAKIEAIWEQEYSLVELLDRSHFKTYDELKARYLAVVNGVSVGTADTADKVKFVDDEEEDVPLFEAPVVKPKPAKKMPVIEDSDDDLDFFTALAKND